MASLSRFGTICESKKLRLTHDSGAIADKYEGFEPSEQPVHDDEQKRSHGTQAPAGGPMLLYQDTVLNTIVICVCLSACVYEFVYKFGIHKYIHVCMCIYISSLNMMHNGTLQNLGCVVQMTI